MSIQIYNTLARQTEPLETLEPGRVKMYVCGPTVYAAAHVGHAMSVLVFDIIRRYLEWRGYEVVHVMNYTDVDDKIIRRASELGVDPSALAESYIQEFREHLQALNVLPATVNPRATQEMDTIIRMIDGLIGRGYAYPVEGDVYFRVAQDEDYGKLSGRRVEDMQAGSRVQIDERKENPLDFALWKSAKPGEPAWDSPWGPGRPGWHIECSAMNLEHLGARIDIHGGGNDLIFPHHENEIAQSESYNGEPFARYWIHNGMLQLSGEKMSKSLGNLVTIEDFLAQHPADTLRMMVLNSSYRSPLTYKEEVITQAERALERLRIALRPATSPSDTLSAEDRQALQTQVEAARQGFVASMDHDFNTAGALGHLFELVRAVNQARDQGAGPETLQPAQEILTQLTGVMGLQLEQPQAGTNQAEPFIDLLLEIRDELRSQKQWVLSDQIRDRLADLGVIIEDSRQGAATWRWKSG